MELRQFIYLDNLAVQTLLASANIAAPESIVQKREKIDETRGDGELQAKTGFPSSVLGASFSGEIDLSKSKSGREVLETNKRIDNQYLFSILYDVLEDNDILKDCTGSTKETSLSKGDVLKIKGKVKTDPFYRLLSVISISGEISDNFGKVESWEEVQEVLYSGELGMKLEIPDIKHSFVMGLDREYLWVDDKREFLDTREYTVFGRVRETIDENEKWDYPYLMRLGDSVTSDETMENIRELVSGIASSLGDFSGSYTSANMNGVSYEELKNTEYDLQESEFVLDIEDNEISVDGPGYVIYPIAIYW